MATTDKPSHLKFSLQTFSDDEITELLEGSDNWRDLRSPKRDFFLSEMRSGAWEPANGECIIMNGVAKVLDGQHRLSAAQIYQRETGHKVWFSTISGVEERTVKTINTGIPRTALQWLRKHKVKNYVITGAIASAQARMMVKAPAGTNIVLGDTLYRVCSSSVAVSKRDPEKSHDAKQTQTTTITVPQAAVIDAYKRHRGAIEEWAHTGMLMSGAKLPHAALIASLLFQLAKQKDTEAKLFASYLLDGSGMKTGDAILALRERLIADRAKKIPVGRVWVAAVVIKTWVAWMNGVEVSRVMWTPKESFPSHETAE